MSRTLRQSVQAQRNEEKRALKEARAQYRKPVSLVDVDHRNPEMPWLASFSDEHYRPRREV